MQEKKNASFLTEEEDREGRILLEKERNKTISKEEAARLRELRQKILEAIIYE